MKLNQLLLLGATSLLISTLPGFSYTAQVGANSSSPVVNSTTTLKETNMMVAGMNKNQSVAVMSGTFVAAEKPTTGTARIVIKEGHRYLELDNAFSTSDQGPDLHVLLDTMKAAPQSYQEDLGRTVNLGRLRSYSGTQRYPIPDAIALENFQSVVIWCRMANATFAYAPLQAVSNTSTRNR